MTEEIRLRPYQQSAVEAMVQHRRGICVAPAGSGKTIIAAECVKVGIQRCYNAGNCFPSIIWLAHTNEQVEQGKTAMARLNPDGFCSVKVCCYASNPDTRAADILVVDEAHHAGAESVQRLVDAVSDSCVVYGFTATPLREDGVDIECIIGPIRYTVGRDAIQAVGGVLPAEVRVVPCGVKDALDSEVDALAKTYYTSRLQWCDRQNGTDEQIKRCQYRAALNIGIRDNEARDLLICKICWLHDSDSVLVLVDSKEHGKRLKDRIPDAHFVSSGSRGRKATLDAFKAGVIRCLICTSLADEGMDAPIAGVLIMAGAGKAFGKIIQRTGRVLRPHPGKDKGIIYDFHDLGHGMLNAQHWQRCKTYKAAGYRVVGLGVAI
jgi:superfamily II DNA or RNA helicase